MIMMNAVAADVWQTTRILLPHQNKCINIFYLILFSCPVSRGIMLMNQDSKQITDSSKCKSSMMCKINYCLYSSIIFTSPTIYINRMATSNNLAIHDDFVDEQNIPKCEFEVFFSFSVIIRIMVVTVASCCDYYCAFRTILYNLK